MNILRVVGNHLKVGRDGPDSARYLSRYEVFGICHGAMRRTAPPDDFQDSASESLVSVGQQAAAGYEQSGDGFDQESIQQSA